ncbi:Uma2 family endonuclease [uncultured Hymenobacter sp.]|uniref:Uma2 family endonuclease n=1 Tax=uncultured Hymenobacter sp. TaxID=170016 RepID=UPI0035CAF0E2
MTPITNFSQLDPNQTYTYADYLTWKFDEFVELVKGRLLRPMAGPSRRHQRYSTKFLRRLLASLDDKTCQVYHAPFDVRLTTGGANGDEQILTVVQPDISVICDLGKLDDRGCLGPPDWIIEIVSPGNTSHDTRTKFDLYEESGVREYWIVFPGVNTVAAYVLEGERYRLAAEYAQPGSIPVYTQPGLTLEWADIFDDV